MDKIVRRTYTHGTLTPIIKTPATDGGLQAFCIYGQRPAKGASQGWQKHITRMVRRLAEGGAWQDGNAYSVGPVYWPMKKMVLVTRSVII